MNRRKLLAVTAVVPALTGCLDRTSSDDDQADGDQATDDQAGSDGPPYEIELIDAPGSEDTTVSVPQPGQVVLINFTRQNCPTSAGYLDNVGEAYDRLTQSHDVGPDGELFVASLIDWTSMETPSNEDLAEWWDQEDGHWPIGIDRSGAFFDAYHGPQYPGTIVFDASGEVRWQHDGSTQTRGIVDEVEAAFDAD